jgi:hypothetical protein
LLTAIMLNGGELPLRHARQPDRAARSAFKESFHR